MKHVVYKTTNIINGKIYIGKHSTSNLNDGYIGSGKLLKQAIEKYGVENFDRDIICICKTEDEAYEMEKSIVNESFVNRDDTYNIIIGGKGIPSGENHPCFGIRGIDHPNFGTKHSDETKRKIGNSRKGYKHSISTKNKISYSNLGKKRTEQQNLRNSQVRTGTKLSEEHRSNIGKSIKGRKHTEDTKIKISISNSKPCPEKIGKPTWNKGIKQDVITCPHCNKSGGKVNMYRYHFNNCRNRI